MNPLRLRPQLLSRAPYRARSLPALLPLLALSACGEGEDPAPATVPPEPVDPSTWSVELTDQRLEVEDLFIAISPVNEDTVWISGTGGRWARTVDGGANWQTGVVEGFASLQFRDVEAFDGSTALLMSIGTGEDSRIFRTTDAGATWTQQWVMLDPEGFIDCMAFWDDDRGIAYGDAVDGQLWVMRTSDGGVNWSRIDPERLPASRGSEGGYASSGSCVDVGGSEEAWIGTAVGDTVPSRILSTTDGGESWTSTDLPLFTGEDGGGVTSLSIRADGLGIATGGSLDPERSEDRFAVSMDGGVTWSLGGALPRPGALYGVAWVPDERAAALVGVGPGGVYASVDHAVSWTALDDGNHWAVAFASDSVGWAVGRQGAIKRIAIVRPSTDGEAR